MNKRIFFAAIILYSFTGSASCRSGKIVSGIASGYPGDLAIEKDSAVIFHSDFENDLEGWTSFCPVCTVIRGDSLSDHSRLLRITATRHVNTGGDVIFRLPAGEDEVYLRFYTYFPNSAVTPHHFVKIISYPIPYFGGNAGKRPPENKYFVLGIEPTPERKWHFYNYWQDMHSWQTYRGDPDPSRGPNAWYGNTFEADRQTAFKKDRWICVEARVKLNDPGDSNGEMTIWIDGRKTGEWKKGSPAGSWRGDRYITSGPENSHPRPFEGFRFRSSDSLKINQISLQWYVSEERAREGSQDDNTVYFDNIVLARKYIGMKKQ